MLEVVTAFCTEFVVIVSRPSERKKPLWHTFCRLLLRSLALEGAGHKTSIIDCVMIIMLRAHASDQSWLVEKLSWPGTTKHIQKSYTII